MINISFDEDLVYTDIWPSNRRAKQYTKLEALIYVLFHIQKEDGILRTSISSLSKEWSWSRNKVRSFLDMLHDDHRVMIEKDNDFTLIMDNKKDTQKDREKDTKKDRQKDSKKDILKSENINIYEDSMDRQKDRQKDRGKDREKDTKKDTLIDVENDLKEENITSSIDMSGVLDIIKM